jgi:type II secretory pathway pseudopilin PulG
MAVNMQIGSRSKQSGFTYIGILMVMVIAGIGLAGVGIVWHQDAQREREKELLFIGDEYRKAIGSYYESTPGTTKQYPTTLEDLIIDKRFPAIKRHLRKVYADPMTFGESWELVLQQGQIVGVHSKSKLEPIKKTGFLPPYETFGEAAEYSDWKFIYTPSSIPLSTTNQNTAT